MQPALLLLSPGEGKLSWIFSLFRYKASIAVQMNTDLRVRSSHFYLGTLFGNLEPVSKGASRIYGNTGVGGLVM